MLLKFEKFESPYDLCCFVNDNEASININGICQDEFGKYVLFYSTMGGVDICRRPEFDAEEIWKMRNRRGEESGS